MKAVVIIYAACLLLAPALLAAKSKSDGEVVARIFDTKIYRKDIEPTEELRKRDEKLFPNQKWEILVVQYRSENLSGRIWGPLRERFMKEKMIEVSNEDLESFASAMMAKQTDMKAATQKSIDQWEEELRESGVSEEKKKTLQRNIQMMKEHLNISDEKQRAGFKSIAKSVVASWKINQALYKQYGGTVIWQQAGIEPVEAVRRFLEERQRNGDFEIYDKTLKDKFWEYFARKHPFEVPKEKVNFDKPWWLWTEDEAEKFNNR